MEGRKLTEIKSDKNLIKIKKKEKKDDVHIARTKKNQKL